MQTKSEQVLTEKDLKRYPHFDGLTSLEELESHASDPDRVAEHRFFPFLQYMDRWMPFGERQVSRAFKERPIRYACRRDSAVLKYYRHKLSSRYESRLAEMDVSSCVLAYRKIPSDGNANRGKCNIDFAADAFSLIKSVQNCSVVTLDIRSYFECIDHQQLKESWCKLIGMDRLPKDHFAVFKAVTAYSYVDRNDLYEALGFLERRKDFSGITRYDYQIPKNEVPLQLCTPTQFRKLVAAHPELLNKNANSHGIPQGSPISDLLANLYLLDFDVQMNEFTKKHNGFYFRYSDDLIIVLPGNEEEALQAKHFTSNLIKDFGSELEIKDSKTCVGCYEVNENGRLTYRYVSGQQGKNGLEYLGFRFDGEQTYIRNNTISRLHRKIAHAARSHAKKTVKRYQNRDSAYLIEKYGVDEFKQRFLRVKDFDSVDSYQGWTFWTYALRASGKFDDNGRKIQRQLRNLEAFIERTIKKELLRALDPINA